MEENKNMENQELNQNANQETNGGQQQTPAPQKEVEEVTVVEVPLWVGKVISGTKKALKFVVPVATAAVGAFVGIKVGAGKERTRSKAQTDALNGTIDDLRNQLEARPLEIPMSDAVSDVPFSEVVGDTISE